MRKWVLFLVVICLLCGCTVQPVEMEFTATGTRNSVEISSTPTLISPAVTPTQTFSIMPTNTPEPTATSTIETTETVTGYDCCKQYEQWWGKKPWMRFLDLKYEFCQIGIKLEFVPNCHNTKNSSLEAPFDSILVDYYCDPESGPQVEFVFGDMVDSTDELITQANIEFRRNYQPGNFIEAVVNYLATVLVVNKKAPIPTKTPRPTVTPASLEGLGLSEEAKAYLQELKDRFYQIGVDFSWKQIINQSEMNSDEVCSKCIAVQFYKEGETQLAYFWFGEDFPDYEDVIYYSYSSFKFDERTLDVFNSLSRDGYFEAGLNYFLRELYKLYERLYNYYGSWDRICD